MPHRLFQDMVLFSGMANEPLAQKVAEHLKLRLGACTEPRRHKDGELRIRLGENVRHKDVFIIQPTNQPDSNLVELCFMIHTALHASAGRITAVIPYFGYARADKKTESRESVNAACAVQFIKAAGADRVVLLDVHSEVVQGTFKGFNIQNDVLWARPTFISYFRDRTETAPILKTDLVVVAPDEGATKLARAYAKAIGRLTNTYVPTAMVEKERPRPGDADVIAISGEVTDKDLLIVDDMIDSAKTICKGAHALKEKGARNIYVCATHGVFSDGAHERLETSVLKKVFVTDSIQQDTLFPKLTVVSVAELLAETIRRTHVGESVNSLFEDEYQK